MNPVLYLCIFFNLSTSVVAIDINTATEIELARELSGIGKVKAQRIVEYRDQIGGFSSIEQLREIKGIGPKTLEKNRHKIEIKTIYQKSSEQSQFNEKISPVSNSKKQIPSLQKEAVPVKLIQPSHFQKKKLELDLSPKVTKLPRQPYHWFWHTILIVPLFILGFFIFKIVWTKKSPKNELLPRKHLVSTTFRCSGCGKISRFQNVPYQGHLSKQNIDNDLPPGWVCIPNGLGKLCDYCFDCSQKVHPNNL